MGGKEQRNSRFEMLESGHLDQQVCRTGSGRHRKHRPNFFLCTEVAAHREGKTKESFDEEDYEEASRQLME